MNRNYIYFIVRRIFLCHVLLIGFLVFCGLNQYGNKGLVYAKSTTKFGMQIDTHFAGKIPDLTQLQQLKPAWIRGDYNKITFAPDWPANVKSIVLVNSETT